MDLVAPLVHEFTYQAMVHDLLPVRDGDKTTYQIKVNEGRPNQEAKDAEISEKDKIWVANRHQHMKDTIDKLMGEFQKFIDANPHFANSDQDNANSLSAIKDMLAGLPQFQEMKEAYSLHLTMAQEAMNIFQQRKLPDLASVEQSLATGFDEDHKKPKNVADQIVRLLDEESVTPPDRLRLIILYILYRDGILPADLEKLISHAQLAQSDGEVVRNLGFLGARISKQLKETRAPPQPLFVQVPSNISPQEEYSLSRFETNLKLLLKDHVKGVLDQEAFPYTKPQLDAPEPADSTAQASLRSAKPTWARGRSSATEPRQRIIVFMAGGATFSESRACYEVTQETNKDVYLLTSHMLTPSLFMRQLGDLSVDKRRLMIPAEQPKPKAPAHVFEPEPAPAAPAPPAGGHRTKAAAPPTAQMQHMNLGASNGARPTNGHVLPSPNLPQPPPTLQQTRLSAQQGVSNNRKNGFVRNGPAALAKAYRKYGWTLPDNRPATHINIAQVGPQTGSVPAIPQPYHSEYLSRVTIGGQSLDLNLDTGSSDFWVFSSFLSPTVVGNHTAYNPNKSSTFAPMPNQNWAIRYGDGSGATGIVGSDTVDIGGATVTSQAIEMATAVSTSFQSDANSDGLVGLAFSSINNVRPTPQKTFFDNIRSSLRRPLFAADLREDGSGAYHFGSAPLGTYKPPIMRVNVNNSQGYWQFASRQITIGGVVTPRPHASPAVADTGTSLLLVDDENRHYSAVAVELCHA
ncbi:hypothetical protein FH972_022304 [Carpinus fangiana]|uniref:Peptidase A1 domain-containing protein n=1 Tax=Carpinus fangiana TaxID=176857 RepID=A0A5N6KRV7_9ROSI|nr:hypothetical protein FH972_022304 [Carpinus fangiana]